MLFVWLGVLALFIGPLVVSTIGRHDGAARALDAFVVVAIGGLVLLHILPESLSEAGWEALGAVLLGATLPTLLHSPLHAVSAPCNSRGTTPLLLLAALAIGLHAFFDGVALAAGSGAVVVGGHGHVAMAVVLHRLLEGTGLWYLMRPHLGRTGTLAAMGLLALATWLGFVGAGWAVKTGGETAMAWIQAAVAGSLLHVLAHHTPGSQVRMRRWAWESSLGATVAVAMLGLLDALEHTSGHSHKAHAGLDGPAHAHIPMHSHGELWHTATQLALGVAPYVLVGIGLTALVHALVPAGLPDGAPPSDGLRAPTATWLRRLARSIGGAFRGLLSDTAFARVASLFAHAKADAAHAPDSTPAAATAYLLLAPAFGVTAGLLSLVCFGPMLTLVRILALIVWAVVTGLVTGKPSSEQSLAHSHEPAAHDHAHAQINTACTQARPLRRGRLPDGVHFALGEGIDNLAPWLFLAVMLGALLETTLCTNELVAWGQSGLDVPLVALLAAPVYISPVVATLTGFMLWQKGLSVGAIVAFGLCASAVSVVSLRQLAGLYTWPKAWTTMLTLVTLSIGLGLGINAIFVSATPASLPVSDAWTSAASAGIVGGLMALSCLRLGVRAFLAPITAWSMHLGRHHHH